jgi:hypothetical protein
MRAHPSTSKRFAAAALLSGVIGGVLIPRVADAHFVLQSPPAWMSQTSLGLPEKLGPCGDEYDGTDASTPTGTVTTVQEGSKITVTINEVIFHPGHYRISLAQDRKDLPAEPVVTAGDTPCGTAPIQSPPVFPVLADGVFVHTTAFTTPQSIEITLPAGVTCTKCTLQVIEFMSQHPLNVPGGCFYHHCADLAIQASGDSGGPPATDSSTPTTDTGGSPPPTTDSGGKPVMTDAGDQDSANIPVAPPPTGTPSSAGCALVAGGTESGATGILTLGTIALLIYGRGRSSRRRRPRR